MSTTNEHARTEGEKATARFLLKFDPPLAYGETMYVSSRSTRVWELAKAMCEEDGAPLALLPALLATATAYAQAFDAAGKGGEPPKV